MALLQLKKELPLVVRNYPHSKSVDSYVQDPANAGAMGPWETGPTPRVTGEDLAMHSISLKTLE